MFFFYFFTVCDYNVHKACYESIEESCPGPKSRKSKVKNTFISHYES